MNKLPDNYFWHDIHAHQDEKLVVIRMNHGDAGYGIWWLMIEYMHLHNGEINDIKHFSYLMNVDFGLAKTIIQATLNAGLTEPGTGDGCSSKRVKKQLEARKEYLLHQSLAGKKSAEKRSLYKANISTVVEPLLQPRFNQDKIREDKIREDKIVSSVVAPRAPTPSEKAFLFFSQRDEREKVITDLISNGNDEDFIRQEVHKFCVYWTEPSRSGKKLRWDMEKTFEIRRRIDYWLSRALKTSPSHQ